MGTVLAAVDASAAARPTVAVAAALAKLLDTSVRAVHVGTADRAAAAESTAARAGIPLEVCDGPVAEVLTARLDAPDVVAGVVGCRSHPTGRRPAGHTALALASSAQKPLVVVPPDGHAFLEGDACRLLVPLDGSETAAAAVRSVLDLFVDAEVDIVVVHVFDPTHVPAFLDRPVYDLDSWGTEFLARWGPRSSRLELRRGLPGRTVVDLAHDEGADIIVLGWSQTFEGGHAAVVRDVLSDSDVPVMLLPVTVTAAAATE